MQDEVKEIRQAEEQAYLDNEWVDVRDMLPELDELVLVTYNYKIKGEKENITTVGTDILLQDGWRNHKNIIAWKPLPKPYRRKEQVC